MGEARRRRQPGSGVGTGGIGVARGHAHGESRAWAEGRGPMGPVGLLTMGSQHDYAARYYLSMSSSRLQVVSLTDPRTREAKYRGLHPRDFSSLLFLDGRASAWPPTSQQRAWLNQNLGCQEQDLVDRLNI